METVRFVKVVQQSGKPEPYTLWLPPAKDAAFQRALRESRVMTLHQETVGTKKDYGLVGFVEGKGKSLLIFPRSLEAFRGKRVIAVKYDLLEEAPPEEENGEPAKAPKEEITAKTQRARSGGGEKPRKAEPAEAIRLLPDPPPKKIAAPASGAGSEELAELKKAVRKAMKALEQGKAVAAFQLLEKALQRSR
jgi:hypothetical protein